MSKKRRTWFGRLGTAVLVVGLTWVVLSICTVASLRWLNPPLSSFMLQTWFDAQLSGDHGYKIDQRWVDLSRISPNLALAVVASEDQKFAGHLGFDVEAIEKAYALNEHSHRVHGGSTISQQVSKNLFLWSGRSYFRKALEAYFTILAEGFWPKKRILEIYLNVAEFGRGIYGAEAAAQRLFHKPSSALTRSDAALLAAVLPNPTRFHANAPSAYVEKRHDWILQQMNDLGGPEMLEEIDVYPARHGK